MKTITLAPFLYDMVWPYGRTAFSGASGPSQSPICRLWRVPVPAQPDSLHCPPVQDFPVPNTVWGVRRMASYYRRFMPRFAKIAAPLHALTRESVPLFWSAACQGAFLKLKDPLQCWPILTLVEALSFILMRALTAWGQCLSRSKMMDTCTLLLTQVGP